MGETMPKMISTPYTAIDMITCCAWPTGLLRIITIPRTW